MADYKRILLKLSGERLGGEQGEVLKQQQLEMLAQEAKALHDAGYELAIVLGGGNILRGKEAAANGIEEAQAHHMGMLATVINSIALQSVMEQQGLDTRVMTAINMEDVAEPYIRRRAIRHLQKGRIVICAAGTGNPFFTTDSAGALRAIEMGADLLIKATKVDGIYTADPFKEATAQHIPRISYKQTLVDDLHVMDGSAVALCRDNHVPLMVCNLAGDSSILKALRGEAKHTLVDN